MYSHIAIFFLFLASSLFGSEKTLSIVNILDHPSKSYVELSKKIVGMIGNNIIDAEGFSLSNISECTHRDMKREQDDLILFIRLLSHDLCQESSYYNYINISSYFLDISLHVELFELSSNGHHILLQEVLEERFFLPCVFESDGVTNKLKNYLSPMNSAHHKIATIVAERAFRYINLHLVER